MADFKILRGSSNITSGNATVTITESTDYTLEVGSDSTNTFIRIVNCHLTGGGAISGGGNQNCDDVYAHISNPANIGTSITFTRRGTASDTRVSWEIIQYIGAASGANEIIVRGQEVLTYGASAVNLTGTTITTIADNADVVVFVTGVDTAETGRLNPQTGQSTTSLVAVSTNWAPRVSRGYAGAGSDVSSVSVAVVEFTGSNWSVAREEFTSNTPAATVWTTGAPTGSGSQAYSTALADATKAFLHNQFRNANTGNAGNDDSWEIVEIDGTANMVCRRSTSTGASAKTMVVWVVENSQGGTGAMSVEHRSEYRSSTAGTEEVTVSTTVTTVGALDETSIMGECSSSLGTGSGTPRGHASLEMTTTSNVDSVWSEVSTECRFGFDVVQWPAEVTGNVAVPAIAAGTAVAAVDLAFDQFIAVGATAAATAIVQPQSPLQEGDVSVASAGTAVTVPDRIDITVDVPVTSAATDALTASIIGDSVKGVDAIPAKGAIVAPDRIDQTVNVPATSAATAILNPFTLVPAPIPAVAVVLAPDRIDLTVPTPAISAAATSVALDRVDQTVDVSVVPAATAIVALVVSSDQSLVVPVISASAVTVTADRVDIEVPVGSVSAATAIIVPGVGGAQVVTVPATSASAVVVTTDRVDQTVTVGAETAGTAVAAVDLAFDQFLVVGPTAAATATVTTDRVDQETNLSAVAASTDVVVPDRIDLETAVSSVPAATSIIAPDVGGSQTLLVGAIPAATATVAPDRIDLETGIGVTAAAAAVVAPDRIDLEVTIGAVTAATAVVTPDRVDLEASVGALPAGTTILAPGVGGAQIVLVGAIPALTAITAPSRVDQTVTVGAISAAAASVSLGQIDQTVGVPTVPTSIVVLSPDRTDLTVDLGAVPSGTTIIVPGITADQDVSVSAIVAGTVITLPTVQTFIISDFTPLTGSRDLATPLTGSYDRLSSLLGSYDRTTSLTGDLRAQD